jgi:hypothetical protein
MKSLMVLAIGLLSSSAFAFPTATTKTTSTGGVTCHQGYEYKMIRDSFGKVGYVPTGRRCVSQPRW